MINNHLSTHNVFVNIVITFITLIFIASINMCHVNAETTYEANNTAKSVSSVSAPQKINLNLTDVFQIEMFSIIEEDSNGKSKTVFEPVSDFSSLQNGTMNGIVCIGTYNDKRIITIISPLRGGEFLKNHSLNSTGTIYGISSKDMVDTVKAELEREKLPEEISNNLDTNHYIVIDDESIMKEAEKRVNKDLEKMRNEKSMTYPLIPIFSTIVGIIIILGLISWRKNR